MVFIDTQMLFLNFKKNFVCAYMYNRYINFLIDKFRYFFNNLAKNKMKLQLYDDTPNNKKHKDKKFNN